MHYFISKFIFYIQNNYFLKLLTTWGSKNKLVIEMTEIITHPNQQNNNNRYFK